MIEVILGLLSAGGLAAAGYLGLKYGQEKAANADLRAGLEAEQAARKADTTALKSQLQVLSAENIKLRKWVVSGTVPADRLRDELDELQGRPGSGDAGGGTVPPKPST